LDLVAVVVVNLDVEGAILGKLGSAGAPDGAERVNDNETAGVVN
jgi:hypothetical protein